MERGQQQQPTRSENQVRLDSRRKPNKAIHPWDMITTLPFGYFKQFNIFASGFVVPWLLLAIVMANVVMFIITMYVNNCPKNSGICIARWLGRFSFQPFKENPFLGPSALTLHTMGDVSVQKVVYEHQGWRLLSSNWLHAGVIHLLSNMFSLLFVGFRLEQELGFVKIGLVYVISGLGGTLLSMLFDRSNSVLGASTAICGLIGGVHSELIINWSTYANGVSPLITLLLTDISIFAEILNPYVENVGHIGGFFSGFFLGFVFLIRPQFGWVRQDHTPLPEYVSISAKSKYKPYQYVLWIISLPLLIVGFTVGLVLLLRGVNGNKLCTWCHYLPCVRKCK